MSSEIKVPTLPESIADATVVAWHKKPGDPVKRDEVLVDVETDKVVLEVPAAEDGVLGEIIENEGATVVAHQVIGHIRAAGSAAAAPPSKQAEVKAESPARSGAAQLASGSEETPAGGAGGSPAGASRAEASRAQTSPVVRRLLAEHDLQADDVKGTGKNGRITKKDVEQHVASGGRGGGGRAVASGASTAAARPAPASSATSRPPAKAGGADEPPAMTGERTERRVPMTRLRARIAERLLDASQNTAMLTTFNEVNMHNFIELRKQYKEQFEKTHGVRLGFMSIFLKAATEALRRFPDINASIDGNDVVYHGFCDIGVAVSSERGLVVPVLRNTENMTLAAIEKGIGEYAEKARDGKLSMEEMTGGTFTVSNGGVFGSLMSTPILNPPQSAILGMHATMDRPIAENGEVVIRPMMYIALSYDHRIVDGKGAVSFLKTVKELVEDPTRVIFDI